MQVASTFFEVQIVANKLQIAILKLRELRFEDFEENGQTLQMQLKQIETSKYNELQLHAKK